MLQHWAQAVSTVLPAALFWLCAVITVADILHRSTAESCIPMWSQAANPDGTRFWQTAGRDCSSLRHKESHFSLCCNFITITSIKSVFELNQCHWLLHGWSRVEKILNLFLIVTSNVFVWRYRLRSNGQIAYLTNKSSLMTNKLLPSRMTRMRYFCSTSSIGKMTLFVSGFHWPCLTALIHYLHGLNFKEMLLP